MKLFIIYFRLFLILIISSHIFANNNQTLKFFENNVLLGEIKTIQNNQFFSVNDLAKITNSKKFINDQTEKIIFYVDNKKIKVTNDIAFILIEDSLYQLSSKVIKDKNDKTVVVMVKRRFIHPFFGKVITSSKKYHAHDEKNKFKEGDNVEIIECKPISKKKTWEVIDR